MSSLPEQRTPALVLTDGPLPEPPADGATVVRLGATPPEVDTWASVTLVVADESVLRRAASTLPPLGRSRSVGVVVREATGPVTLTVRQEWPPLRAVDARFSPDGSATTILRFGRPPLVADVLVELARATGMPVTTGNGGLVGGGALGVPVDASAVTADVPPSVVPPGTTPPPSDVPALPPVVLEPDPGIEVGPLDEALLNPSAFDRSWSGPVVDLDRAWSPGPALVASLRAAQGVRVTWPAPERLVAALAMAGVPLLAGPVPSESRARLGAELTVALEQATDLDDARVREEHSIRLRRAALDAHGVRGWRDRVGDRMDVRTASWPPVSVVLTASSDRLEHAREQVAAQQGVELDVVLPGEPVRHDLVLRTDADGWWAPEAVRDLLRARRYSGAHIVQAPDELVRDEDHREAVRREVATEVAVDRPRPGGLVLAERRLGRDLEAACAGGARVYVTHGLAHVARAAEAGQ